MSEKINVDWDALLETLPDEKPQRTKPATARQRCSGRDCPHPGHVFIPDPGKWVGVMLDGFARFDIVGFRYCPTLDDSHPIVTTTNLKGAGILHLTHGFIVVIPRWEGVKFGSRDPKAQAEAHAHLEWFFGKEQFNEMSTAALHYED